MFSEVAFSFFHKCLTPKIFIKHSWYAFGDSINISWGHICMKIRLQLQFWFQLIVDTFSNLLPYLLHTLSGTEKKGLTVIDLDISPLFKANPTLIRNLTSVTCTKKLEGKKSEINWYKKSIRQYLIRHQIYLVV